jgi:colanic acid biosynthesis protein WcaH
VLERPEFREIVRTAPLVSIDLIVKNRDDEVLLGFRKTGPAKNTWFVPGGRIRKDEKLEMAFTRVTEDELGISLDWNDACFLRVSEHFYEGNFADEPDFGTHYIVLAYEIRISLEDSKLPLDQHSDYRWMSEKDLLLNSEVHAYTKDYFREPDRDFRSQVKIGTSDLLSLYNIHQTATSYYTNIIWALPAALFVLNFVAWTALEKNPKMRLYVAFLNVLFLQAFLKLVRNQRAITTAIRNVERTLTCDLPSCRVLIPNFQYGWFTKLRSGRLFSWWLTLSTVVYMAYVLWKYFLS